MEMGRTGFKPRDVADLLTLYGVGDGTVRESLLAMAKKSNAPGWWHAYGDVLRLVRGLRRAGAGGLGHPQGPGPARARLPDAEDYARATIQLGHQNAPSTKTGRRVRLRIRAVSGFPYRPDPPMLWAVLDEAALRRPIGGAATMRAQIQHLITLAGFPTSPSR